MITESNLLPDDVCEIDGQPINDVILVGRLTSEHEEAMRKNFEINDNTGSHKITFY